MFRATRGQRLSLCGLAAIAAAGVIGWAYAPGFRFSTIGDSLPAISPGPWLNANQTTAYVGAAACIKCHPAQHESYLETMHSRSLSVVDPTAEPDDATFEVSRGRRIYSAYREDDVLRHRESFRARDGSEIILADHALQYVMGSGHFSRTYLIESDGFLMESPITWYQSQKEWALSPGYDRDDASFARPVYFDCVNCHAGRVEASSLSDGRLTITECAIGCERCHGPGERHVHDREAGRAVPGRIDRTIVNPAHLDRERREAVCSQCHLDGVAAVELSGRRGRDYRPGLAWADFRVDYALDSIANSMTVVGHVAQMRDSRCYSASETMTCTTCHDPHARPDALHRVEHYREKCLSCHTERNCRVPAQRRVETSAQDDCTLCHMPQATTEIPHLPATHHRIGIHTANVTSDQAAPVCELRPILPAAGLPPLEQERSLGLAYLQVSMKEAATHESERYRVKARELLQSVRRRRPLDADVLAALAMIDSIDRPRQAVEFAETALNQKNVPPGARVRALFALSEIYRKQRQPEQARFCLEQLVALRRQAGDWFRLALFRERAGELPAAAEAAGIAVMIMPQEAAFHDLVSRLAVQRGDAELSETQRQIANELHALRSGD